MRRLSSAALIWLRNLRSRRLPLQVEAEFEEPRQIVLRRIQSPELRVGNVHRGDSGVPRVVQQIHALELELQPRPFVNLEVLRNRSVPILIPRQTHIAKASWEVTKGERLL